MEWKRPRREVFQDSLLYTFFGGECCWEVQMQQNELTIKRRNIYISNIVKDLIPFKKDHQGLLRLHVTLVGE